MNKISLIIILLLFFSCQDKTTNKGYSINGIAKNVADSTKILLYLYPEIDVIADSTMVINEEFEFKGNINRPKLAHLRIIESRDDRTFWLENKKIDFIGEKGSFSKSKITGSNTQKESEILLERKDSIFKEMARLEALVTDKNMDSLFVIYEKMEMVGVEISKQFIKEFPNSYESLFQLHLHKEKMGNKETAKAFNQLNAGLQITDEGNAIKAFISKNKNLKIGDKFVDFKQPDIDGHTIKFSDIKGKYTLIEFWASWCGPCRSFNPELKEQYNLYKEKGFEIVGVSIDTNKEKWGKAIEKDELTWKNLSDLSENNEVAMIYGVSDIPDNFLIDENGIIIARFIRGESLINKLKELFDEKTNL